MNDISEHKYLFHEGRDYRAYEFMGAHPVNKGEAPGSHDAAGKGEAPGSHDAVNKGGAPGSHDAVNKGEAPGSHDAAGKAGDAGVVFRVWAPRATQVSVVGSFNYWDPATDPMHRLEDDPSIWELYIERARIGDLYKFAITDDGGNTVQKADPYAFFSETGNANEGSQRASIVYGLDDGYSWNDAGWMEARTKRDPYRSAMNIYEVHLGSWMRKPDGRIHTYRETADMLIPYVKEMGYTHIEVLPITEYPFDGSWGYQVTGYYSPTSRYGRPDELKYLIDTAHANGIGVIMDWVPAHFTKDEHGLIDFDGHPLYEDSNPYRMEHKGWGTRAFDFGRPEVLSFLISDAYYFCDIFHIDGLRVDAVAAMLYLDYGREDGEWQPNSEGGRENKEAINFLQNMNRDVLSAFPGVVTVAEESTAWAGITLPPENGGLGFNFKWNMGWMNDELEYFETDPYFRGDHHHELVFSLDYVWGENYILPISHDEVVHGKKSLIDKMAGYYEDKFSGIKAFFAYMYAHPGKKLSFMGNEFGQFMEWSEEREIDWPLLEYDTHRRLKDFVQDLNMVYKGMGQLFALDNDPASFRWINGGDIQNSIISFIRYSSEAQDDPLVVILNLSGSDVMGYKVGVPGIAPWVQDGASGGQAGYVPVIDTDDKAYGGHGKRNVKLYGVNEEAWDYFDHSIVIDLPALSAIYLKQGM